MSTTTQSAPATRTVTAKLRSGRGRNVTSNPVDGASAESVPQQGRFPRIARLMALAIRLDGMLQRGEVRSQRELAEVARVTPARLTQILNLLHLAPDIQERLLLLPPVLQGRDVVTERNLRGLAVWTSWEKQRSLAKRLF